MAWFDILGGVAGGLQQGLGQLQQAQQAKQVEGRQQALLKIQQEQEARAAKQQALEMAQAKLTAMAPGEDLDPNDPEVAFIRQQLGTGVFVRGKAGDRIQRRMSPAEEKAFLELSAYKDPAAEAIRKAELLRQERTTQERQRIEDMLVSRFGPDYQIKLHEYDKVPRNIREQIGGMLGNPELFSSPEEKLQRTTANARIAADASIAAAKLQTAALTPYRDAQTAALLGVPAEKLRDDFMNYLKTRAGIGASLRILNAKNDPKVLADEFVKYQQSMPSAGGRGGALPDLVYSMDNAGNLQPVKR